jgi:hypothetical protein
VGSRALRRQLAAQEAADGERNCGGGFKVRAVRRWSQVCMRVCVCVGGGWSTRWKGTE